MQSITIMFPLIYQVLYMYILENFRIHLKYVAKAENYILIFINITKLLYSIPIYNITNQNFLYVFFNTADSSKMKNEVAYKYKSHSNSYKYCTSS